LYGLFQAGKFRWLRETCKVKMKKILLKLMEFYTYKHLLFKSRKTHTLKSTRNVESTIKTRKWDSPETEKC